MNQRNFRYSFLSALLCLILALAACSTQNTEQTTESKESKDYGKGHGEQWSYEGETGPENWGELDPSYSSCINGNEQSPINIEISKVQPNQALEDIKISYEPTLFTLKNNGHTIQASTTEPTNTMIVEGTEYKLAQFHFHQPSEHQFNGKNFDMELHLVHQDKDNKLAVLGLMIKEGRENKSLTDIWSKFPAKETKEDLKLDQPIDLGSLLPDNQKSFRYNGSLTTPPCSEKAKWIVLEEPIEMSKEQIDNFKKIFPENTNRPVQSLNDREVTTEQ